VVATMVEMRRTSGARGADAVGALEQPERVRSAPAE